MGNHGNPVIAVRENCPLEDAAKLILERKIGCLPVVNEKAELSGIVTDSDFVAKEKELPLSRFPRLYFGLSASRPILKLTASFTRHCIS